MNRAARSLKNEYMKNWRQKNRDKVKAAQERYWSKKAEESKMLRKKESKSEDSKSETKDNKLNNVAK